MCMFKLFHVNPFKTANSISVILLNGKEIIEMGKVQKVKERVATLIDNHLTDLFIWRRFLFRVPVMCLA